MSEENKTTADPTAALYYDGDCAFCTACVRFVERYDRHRRIKTVPLQQSEHASGDGCYETILFIKDEKQSQYSSAVIDVLKTLGGGWYLLAGLIWIIPKPLRDWGYKFIGARRHWLGGQKPTC